MESENNLLTQKKIIIFAVMLIVVVAIPVGVYLVQRQTQLKSKAAQDVTEPIKFPEASCPSSGSSDCTTTATSVDVLIQAPLPPESALGGTGISGNGGGGSDE